MKWLSSVSKQDGNARVERWLDVSDYEYDDKIKEIINSGLTGKINETEMHKALKERIEELFNELNPSPTVTAEYTDTKIDEKDIDRLIDTNKENTLYDIYNKAKGLGYSEDILGAF